MLTLEITLQKIAICRRYIDAEVLIIRQFTFPFKKLEGKGVPKIDDKLLTKNVVGNTGYRWV